MKTVSIPNAAKAGLCVFFAACCISIATAQDNFDGAVWRFRMSKKQTPAKVLVGQFRVSDHVLFQKDTPSDPEFSKKVGRNSPNGKKTRIDVDDFRVFTKEKKRMLKMKGTARLSLDKVGEWSGIFTTGKGDNWTFKASRIKE